MTRPDHATLVFAAIALTMACAAAQEPQPPVAAESAPGVESIHLRKLDVDFPGGKISALLARLEEAAGGKPNILVDSKSAEVEIPALSLRSVTIPEIMDAVSQLHSSLRVDIGRGRSIITLTYSQPNMSHTRPRDDRRSIQLFNIDRYLDTFKIEDIVTAVETAWGMLGDSENASVLFHEETRLLIAGGTSDQLSAIHQVLSELEQSLPAPPNPISGTGRGAPDPAATDTAPGQEDGETDDEKEDDPVERPKRAR